jgi:hypothetical protein
MFNPKKSYSCTGLERLRELQRVETVKMFIWYTKVATFSVLHTGRLYSVKEYLWYSFLLEAE